MNVLVFILNDGVNGVDNLGLDSASFLQLDDVVSPITKLYLESEQYGGGAAYTIVEDFMNEAANILVAGTGAECECTLKSPERWLVTAEMHLPKEKSSVYRNKKYYFVDSETIIAAKAHEQKHVAIAEHFSSIYDQLVSWQNGIKPIKGADCKQTMQSKISACAKKAQALFTDSVRGADSTHSGQKMEGGVTKVPENWVPGKELIGNPNTMVEIYVLRMTGEWNLDLKNFPVPTLSCD